MGTQRAATEAGYQGLFALWQFGAATPSHAWDWQLRCVCCESPLIASAPRSVAEKDASEPWNDPMGVRTAAAMQTSADSQGVSAPPSSSGMTTAVHAASHLSGSGWPCPPCLKIAAPPEPPGLLLLWERLRCGCAVAAGRRPWPPRTCRRQQPLCPIGGPK